MKNKHDVFYSLNVEDLQIVAIREIGRELSDEEIKTTKKLVAEQINWYEAILNSINETIKLGKT